MRAAREVIGSTPIIFIQVSDSDTSRSVFRKLSFDKGGYLPTEIARTRGSAQRPRTMKR